jgi:hypothetical protein
MNTRNQKSTKKGPGRKAKNGKLALKWTLDMQSKDRDVKACVPPSHKSMVGREPRRVWLGGISAMRGW